VPLLCVLSNALIIIFSLPWCLFTSSQVPAAIGAASKGILNAAAIEALITKVQSTHVRIPSDLVSVSQRRRGLHAPMVDIKHFVLQCQHCLVLPFTIDV
jgi:hypothetical protein